MYQLFYYADTKDLNDVSLRVEIYKDSEDEITAKELTLGGDSPIVIEYDGDGDIFKTLIQSTCTIDVVTEEPLLNLYTGKLNEICLKVYRGDELFWYGFLTPNIYSQEYEACANSFELEFVDFISHLEDIKFTKTTFFSSFYQYIFNAITLVDKMGVITGIVNQENLPINLKTMGVLERNFIDETADEDNGAMTYKELFESIIAWMSKSMIQWKDKLYIIDLSDLQDSIFAHYDMSTSEKTLYTLDSSILTLIRDVGINKSNCSINLGNVYNKVTVIENSNQIESVIPELLDDEAEYIKCMSSDLDYTTTTFVSNRELGENEIEEDKTHVLLNAFFISQDWGLPYGYIEAEHPDYYTTGDTTTILNDNVNVPSYDYGSPNWVIGGVDTGIKVNFFNFTAMSKYALTDDGYWIVNVPYDYFGNYIGGTAWTKEGLNVGDPMIFWGNIEGYTQGVYVTQESVSAITGINAIQRYVDYTVSDGEPSSIDWKTVLSLGMPNNNQYLLNYGYHGDEEPTNYITLLNKTSFVGMGGYFILSMSYIFSNVKCFANTTPYNFTTEVYGSGLTYSNTDIRASFRDDEFKVILGIGNWFYNGSEWIDSTTPENSGKTISFKVIHKNRTGDKIFGESKSIDNTVSYTWNLANSQDGYAIKLPKDKVMSGDLTFTVYADSRIGGCAQKPNCGIIPKYGDSGWDKFDGFIQNCSPILGIHFDKLELIYTTSDTVTDVYNLEEYDPDIKFTNIVDESYITELDDIELTTNTYNTQAVSYSYVLKKNGEGDYSYVIDVDGEIMEERILKKYVNHYKLPKLIYENGLMMDKVTPFNALYIPSLDKTMIPIGLEFDLTMDRVQATLTEY